MEDEGKMYLLNGFLSDTEGLGSIASSNWESSTIRESDHDQDDSISGDDLPSLSRDSIDDDDVSTFSREWL
jgi:hypothetical protein